MKKEKKKREQLMSELVQLRQRIAELVKAEAESLSAEQADTWLEETLRESAESHLHTHSSRTITDLEPGDHLCCLYEKEEEHRLVLTAFLRRGLEGRGKVVYIVDAHTAESILGYLQDDGLDVEPFVARGQLSILAANDSYVRKGVFHPDGMIALLRDETERALAEGYSALRVTGEMTWALRGLAGSERLVEYESRLNEFLPDSKCLAICQYDRRRFDPETLLGVLRTHPIAIVGTVIRDNFYYIPPAELLGHDLSAEDLRQWLKNLATPRPAEETVRENEKRLSEQNLLLKENILALREVMQQLKAEQGRMEGRIRANVDQLVIPLLVRLKEKSSQLDRAHLDLLEDNLKGLTSSFGSEISKKLLGLTQREIEICNMIRSGLTSKEIARLLNVAYRTVETHRNHIRKKLGIANKAINLTTYLKTLSD